MFQKATSFIHGRGKDFFQRGREGATGRFFQHFSRVGKSGELFFFPLKTKKTILLAKDFKILLPPPFDAHVFIVNEDQRFLFIDHQIRSMHSSGHYT